MYHPIIIPQFAEDEYQVHPTRPHSAPSKPLSENGSESDTGDTGESSLCTNSMPQTPRTPRETGTASTTAANMTPAKSSDNNSSSSSSSRSKRRNNKNKVPKKQQHESGRSGQGSAGKMPGLLIIDSSSRSKSARKDTAGDSFPAESPSQAGVKPEPPPKENRQGKKPYVSPGHSTPSQYANHTDMPAYQEGYCYNEPPRQDYPATYVQHQNAYNNTYQQGYQPPYQPRFDQVRYEHARYEQQRYDQRPGPYRGGYGGYHQHSRYHHHNQYHHHQHQGMADYRRDDGSYYAGHAQHGHSGYTPPKSNFPNTPWRSRQVSADYETVPTRSSPSGLPISPQNVTEAAAGQVAENTGPVLQDGQDASPKMLAAEQLNANPDLVATPANVDTKLETSVKSDAAVEQLDAKSELSSTAKESTASLEKFDVAEKSPEKPAVSELDDEDSDATIEMDFRRMDNTAESDVSTEIVAAEEVTTTEPPMAACSTEELAAPETETLASPGGSSSDQVIQRQDSLIVRFAAVDMADVLPLADHLINMYTGRTNCDMEIEFNSTHKNWLDGHFSAHRVIVAQSIVLQSILDRLDAIHGKLKMELKAGKRFKILRSFDCALQNLYGLPLLEYDDIAKHTRLALYPSKQVPSHVAAQELDFLIGYMTAGAFMAIDRIALTGFRLMQDYIHWNNLETAFHFGVYPQDFLIMYCEVDEPQIQTKKAAKGNKGKGRKKPVELPPIVPPLNRQVVDSFAPRIAALAAQWLVENMPIEFTFDRAAYTSISLQDRIPPSLLIDKSSGTPAPTAAELTGLEQGRRERQPGVAHSLISGILLALPYEQLHEIVALLRRQGTLTAQLVRDVLQEREQRRIRALREYVRQLPNNKVRNPPPSHVVLGYREFAVHFETRDKLDERMQEVKDDFTLHREWVGYQTGGQAEPVLKKFRA
ncbi:hypothetical protein PISL3812_03763 [Talaromyces islandicus]|uniref:Uncharacterized protein n=1 Tax=Talaromyces islandicus TaxID=28573 RepID=A0A0U1LUH0_TALIS|nr:hypothetical protein PISL3812_03763 [Talaromyces islandicus]